MKAPPKNVAASIQARLLAGAQERREDFNLTLQRYAAERFLYRLGASRHRERFVLKGAMLFTLWSRSLYRATRDLDLTGYTEDDPQALVAAVQEICSISCAADALAFQPDTVRAESIRDKSEYHGVRVKLLARSARKRRQVVEGRTVCVVSCQRSPEPVFLKWKGLEASADGDFFVRSGPGTVKLPPGSATEYVRTRFSAVVRPVESRADGTNS